MCGWLGDSGPCYCRRTSGAEFNRAFGVRLHSSGLEIHSTCYPQAQAWERMSTMVLPVQLRWGVPTTTYASWRVFRRTSGAIRVGCQKRVVQAGALRCLRLCRRHPRWQFWCPRLWTDRFQCWFLKWCCQLLSTASTMLICVSASGLVDFQWITCWGRSVLQWVVRTSGWIFHQSSCLNQCCRLLSVGSTTWGWMTTFAD